MAAPTNTPTQAPTPDANPRYAAEVSSPSTDTAQAAIAEIERLEGQIVAQRARRDDAIRAAHAEGMSQPDIARALDMSTSNVRYVIKVGPRPT